MTPSPSHDSRRQRTPLLTSVTRTLLPSYGARCNAADGLRDVRSDRDDRAAAAAAFARTRAAVDAQDRR
ncbi:MAG: hypothetical protein AVDCRST_MAG16-2083 [uncultured Frankineae bacterium]|uniref:Uncharacterized protein n=1 Tax=uncultured Frankineae bacterium TaxID=437475 RepID=A0A6J4LZV4_9ACTN|nr:MAG: hypothetical protein AVDCRST_MAG16-2083 [uncultured Frankineae bacterium]